MNDKLRDINLFVAFLSFNFMINHFDLAFNFDNLLISHEQHLKKLDNLCINIFLYLQEPTLSTSPNRTQKNEIEKYSTHHVQFKYTALLLHSNSELNHFNKFTGLNLHNLNIHFPIIYH